MLRYIIVLSRPINDAMLDFHVATVDSVYQSIGIISVIVELALIATTPQLGKYALETSFLIQILLAVSVETLAGSLVSRISPQKAIIYGMASKVLCNFFLVGAILTIYILENSLLAWFQLIVFFVIDALGSGFLQVAMKPGYAKFYKKLHSKGESIDFLNIFSRRILFRIGMPVLMILAITALSAVLERLELDYLRLYGALFLLAIIILLRLVQVAQSIHDMRIIPPSITYKASHSNGTKISIKNVFQNIRGICDYLPNYLIYILGNFCVLSTLMYLTGVIFKILDSKTDLYSLNWMAGGIIALSIQFATILLSKLIYEMLGASKSKTLKPMLPYVAIVCLASTLGYLSHRQDSLFDLMGLWIYCILTSVLGVGFLRRTATVITAAMDEDASTKFFFVSEFVTNILMISIVLIHYFAILRLDVVELIYVISFLLSAALILNSYFFHPLLHQRLKNIEIDKSGAAESE